MTPVPKFSAQADLSGSLKPCAETLACEDAPKLARPHLRMPSKNPFLRTKVYKGSIAVRVVDEIDSPVS